MEVDGLMNEKTKNKILIAIIIFMIVIIAALVTVIVINNNKIQEESKAQEKSTKVVETEPEPTTQVQTTPESTTEIFDASQYDKGIYQEVGTENVDVEFEGGVQLEILSISKKQVSFRYTVISGPPSNRIAEIEIQNANIQDGKADFTFDDDGWGNRGKGYIQFMSEGKIKIKTDIARRDSEAMWDIGELKHTLVRIGE